MIDGRRRKLTKRAAIVTQMVDKSASADLRATKMLIDMMKDVEQREPGGSGEAAAARLLLISFDLWKMPFDELNLNRQDHSACAHLGTGELDASPVCAF